MISMEGPPEGGHYDGRLYAGLLEPATFNRILNRCVQAVM